MMKAIKTREVIPGIFVIRSGFVNFYLVKGEKGYIALDAGMLIPFSKIATRKLGINPEDVTAVFLTHSDNDHVGGIGAFSNAKVYLPKQEVQMIDGSTRRNFILKNRCKHPYATLVDGQIIETDGLRIRCVNAPGHTKGSACYIVNDQYLFSGDNCSLKKGKASVFSKFINMDSKTQQKSIRKIAKLQGIKGVFTAHHGYTEDFSLAFRDWMRT